MLEINLAKQPAEPPAEEEAEAKKPDRSGGASHRGKGKRGPRTGE